MRSNLTDRPDQITVTRESFASARNCALLVGYGGQADAETAALARALYEQIDGFMERWSSRQSSFGMGTIARAVATAEQRKAAA